MYQAIDIITKEYNVYNSPTWWVPVGQGDLVLFPSRLMHQVANITTDTVRISLAFNVFIKGSIGRGQDLNLLSL
jgi:predicted 2-oxoglutarate/Fe(II)-dependent dioxygenase YbiX